MSDQYSATLPKHLREKPLVLVVDDNYDNVAFACGSLDIFGYEYLMAMNGKAAIEMAMENLPDLILLDIVMPEMSGITVAQTLKNNPVTKHIHLIAITGLTHPKHKEEILIAGCDDYLCKPYFIEDLESKVGRVLSCVI